MTFDIILAVEVMPKGIPISEVLRCVLEDMDGDSSSSDDEIVGNLRIGDDQLVWEKPRHRINVCSDLEPCQMDSALLNDDEVGEVNELNFCCIFVFSCKYFYILSCI